MDIHAPQSEKAEPDRPAETGRATTMKFTYPSGSRPLKGYTIKRGVGRGGFGEVYFATSDAGKEVALKLIRRNLEIELRGVRQCLNLKHPNLVALFDIRADDVDDRWVVMEYVSGESLEDAIDRNPNGMPVEEALRWVHGICAGVAYLHDHGIVHRDLKPGNIFCDEGLVKVGDYGLAKFISCSRRSGQTESVGTVHYMAPEISNGRYGREIDVYALGVILYEALTGKVPFEGESIGEVLMKHLTAEPDLSKLNEPYRSIVRKALAKDPASRLGSVAELANMLPSPLDGPGYVCHPPRPRALNETTVHPNTASGDEEDVVILSPADSPTQVEIAEVVDAEEPIMAGIRSGWNQLGEQWRNADLHPALRTILVVIGVIGLIATSEFWMPILFTAFVFYGIYWAFRTLVVKPKTVRYQMRPAQPEAQKTPVEAVKPQGATEPKVAPVARRQRRRHHAKNLRQHLSEIVTDKPFRLRLTELIGSMLVATIVATTVSLVMLVLSSGGALDVALLVWFSLIGTLGAWAVMIPAKFTEGKIEDQAPMRFIMLVMGLMVGLAAAGFGKLFAVSLPLEAGVSEFHRLFAWQNTNSLSANMTLAAYVGYFGFLFVILRWWLQTGWTRHARLSLWSVVCCIFWAWLLHLCWWFPQPAGMMIAAVIAVTTQLSSPWLPMSKRKYEKPLAASP